jgi:hypothetical protein
MCDCGIDQDTVEVEFVEKRHGVPDDCVSVFEMEHGYFVIYDADAVKCVGMEGICNFADEPIPRAVITEEDSMAGFYSLLLNRRKIALLKRRYVRGKVPDWKNYATINCVEDMIKWREGRHRLAEEKPDDIR